VLVNLLGAKTVSVGTVWELGVAYTLRKPVVLVMERDNPHNHPMSRITAGGRIVADLDEAITLLTCLIGDGV
jgi:nucleoside 2-deoxyribosyltransferase